LPPDFNLGDHVLALFDSAAERFFDVSVFARLHGRDQAIVVQVIRRGDDRMRSFAPMTQEYDFALIPAKVAVAIDCLTKSRRSIFIPRNFNLHKRTRSN
jgi:hypothetical protein